MLSTNLQWNCCMNQNLTFVTSAVQRQHILNRFFLWSLHENDCLFIWNLHDTQTRQTIIVYCQNFSWTRVRGCNPCGRCAIVTLLPQFAKLLKTHEIMVSKVCKLIWVGILPLFWTRVTFCHLEVIWVDQETNPDLISRPLPLKTIVDNQFKSPT